MKKTSVIVMSLLMLSAAVIISLHMIHPKLSVYAFATEPGFEAVGLLPLGENEEEAWRARIEAAKDDPIVAMSLLHSVREEYGKKGTRIPRQRLGVYSHRCSKGNALVYHFDEEGYAYFEFVNLDKDMEIILDRPENGLLLARSQ